MSVGRMAAERQRRGHHGDAWAAESAGDSRRRAEAGPTITVHVPLEFHQRRGRKVLVAPDGTGQAALRASPAAAHTRDEAPPAVRALARAFRWRRLLETGAVATVQEIATAESINSSYVSRVLRLTLLSPEFVEALMADRLGAAAPLDVLVQPFASQWRDQPRALL